MPDSVDKKGPVRLSPKLREWLDQTAADEFLRTKRRPSHPELLDRLYDAARNSKLPVAAPAPAPMGTKHAKWHAMLDDILRDGTPEDVTGIQANLRWGAESVAKNRPATRRRAV